MLFQVAWFFEFEEAKMKRAMIFFAVCVLAVAIFAQNKGDDAQPQFSREPTGTELVKPLQMEPLPSSLTNSEMQAWDMIFRALEKDPASKGLQAKEPPTRLSNKRQGNNQGAGLSKSGSEAFGTSRGQGRRPESSVHSAKGESAGRGIRGNSNQGLSRGESAEKEAEDDDDREGLPSKRPPGWDVGKKEGWKGGDTPPGLRKQKHDRQRGGK